MSPSLASPLRAPNPACYNLTPKISDAPSHQRIQILRTDGDPNFTVPASYNERNARAEPDADGQYDYFEEASTKVQEDWLKKIGRFFAVHVDFPSATTDSRWPVVKSSGKLTQFPDGYKLYTKFKGPDRANLRTDQYLFGSTYGYRFRSPAEVYLHFYWLTCGMPMKSNGKPDCLCTYCSGRDQREISHKYSHYTQRTSAGAKEDQEDSGSGKGKKSQSGGTPKRRTARLPSPDPTMYAKDYRTAEAKAAGASGQ